ncbi:MAG: sn-glycerol-3-phosphate ABC transporter ATP-binding protein UgpC [Hyphomicrobiales bacterium]
MSTVEFRKIGKSFGSVEVLRDIDLTIGDGDFTVLLGPSGCGKTTLLRMTAGLETVSAGEIHIGERVVNDIHPRDRDIAMVFQNYALYPTMRVSENIGFSLEVAGHSKQEIRQKVEEAAAMLSLTDYLDRYPKELSGGQRQRVAMGRAMVRDAQVFLFDEPLSNLDAKLRAHMRVEIRQLHDRLSATTLYVTHDQIEAMTMADKIVLMQGGNIVQSGTPDELYDSPSTKYAAEFIGSPAMNFLNGVLEVQGGEAFFSSSDLKLKLPENYAALENGRELVCGIRPTDVSLSQTGDISGKLIIAEKTGAEIQLHMSIQGTDFSAVVSRDAKFSAGDQVTLAVEPNRLHIFDAATELRL